MPKTARKETETPTAKNGASTPNSSSSASAEPVPDGLKVATLETAIARANEALRKYWDEIWRTFREAYTEYVKANPSADSSKMKFPARMIVRLRPRRGDVGVQVKITQGISRSYVGLGAQPPTPPPRWPGWPWRRLPERARSRETW